MLSQKENQTQSRTGKRISLNSENYYDLTTDKQYQSPTFFKKFLACEAAAMAEINGKYKPDFKKALLVGNYLHSYFESPEAHQKFIDKNQDELLSKRKPHGLLKEYKDADKIIDTLKDDDGFTKLYQGSKEVIVTGQIDGVDWKGKVDCLNLEKGYFIDLKTTQDILKVYWNSETRTKESFVAKWNYQLQMYVYKELIYQTFGVWCDPYIAAVSKQDIPDKAIISIPDERLYEAEALIDEKQSHIEDVKNGIVEPERCERCEYCILTKKLNEIVSMDDIIN
ncbi:PD-(D/E)XK nuclease-like domain-containing protein [Companilactobacillus baiquanensis]|uniref:PD-(D/E)XK nuclease-like domain-containing protein n=1 Tax=Companilactobacillus baiquanensis TaxID=2486005 RepID=A0ABW1V0A9_9LACO|nr:PD-(D/E)XK nuclease-like domain-containing protein [Companilactobacillus baiquanensis]